MNPCTKFAFDVTFVLDNVDDTNMSSMLLRFVWIMFLLSMVAVGVYCVISTTTAMAVNVAATAAAALGGIGGGGFGGGGVKSKKTQLDSKNAVLRYYSFYVLAQNAGLSSYIFSLLESSFFLSCPKNSMGRISVLCRCWLQS